MKRQIIKKIATILLIWLFIGLSGFLFRHSPAFRAFYVTDFYPFFEKIRLYLLGWCPFSIGDILYCLAGIWLIAGIVELVRALIFLRKYPHAWLRLLFRGIVVSSLCYAFFLWGWAYNYHYDRTGRVFAVQPAPYKTAELKRFCCWLAGEVNKYHRALDTTGEDSIHHFLSESGIIRRIPAYYSLLAAKYPSLHYVHASIKPSMFGSLMNYAGITGYFNPFTGEAQLNTTAPPVGLPFTTCHEVAHQLGFAAEDDANFVGYLVASSAPDPHFRYSAHFEILPYVLRALSYRDTTAADSIWQQVLLPGVRKDYDVVEHFYQHFSGPVNGMLTVFYDHYLKANDQELGIKSYSHVINLLLNYFRTMQFSGNSPLADREERRKVKSDQGNQGIKLPGFLLPVVVQLKLSHPLFKDRDDPAPCFIRGQGIAGCRIWSQCGNGCFRHG